MPTLKLDGDAAGAVRATSEVGAAARKLDQDFKQALSTAERYRKTHDESFGSQALGQLANYASGVISVGAAVGFVTNALREQAAEKERLARLDESALKAAGRLSAVGGSQADLDFARQLHAKGIVDTDVQGIHAITGFRQARLTGDEQQYMAGLADKMIVDPATMGDYAQSVQAFRRSQGGGSFETTEKQIRKAAALTRFSPEEVALQATRLADPGAESGISREEQLATLIVEANKSRNLKTGGAAAEKLVAQGGRYAGADAVEFAKTLAQVQAAGSEGVPSSLIHTDSRLRAADAAGDAAAASDASFADGTSEATNLYNTIRRRRSAADRAYYGTGFMGAVNEAGMGIGHWMNTTLGRQQQEIRHAANDLSPAEQRERGLTTDDVAAMKDYLRRIAETTERGDRAAPPPAGRQE